MHLYPRSLRLAVLGIGIVVITSVSYMFAATNTVPATSAGDGSAAISGYTISNVVYGLNAGSPQNIDQVTFDVDVDPTGSTTMKIQLDNPSGAWYTCTNVTVALTCVTTAPQAAVVTADQLRVIIAD